MKLLIWFLCLFLFVILQVIIKNMGYIIGGIPMMLLWSLFYCLGKSLCNAWEVHHEREAVDYYADKKMVNNSSLADNELNNKNSISSQRYCKYCGSPINTETQKCTNCGKQYLRLSVLKKSDLVLKIVLVISLFFVSLCLYRGVQYQNQIGQLFAQIAEQNETINFLQSELEVAKSDISEIQNKYRAKFSEAYDLSQKNKEMKRIYDYCEKNMVFVINQTDIYHKAHCYMVQSSEASFEGFFISTAKQKGYSPCWLCCNHNHH